MGLRCLMGHDFGELQTERDRQERGDEVVVTIREFRECQRCGEVRVASENKEVRRASPPSADADATDDESVADAGADDLGDVTAEEDDGVILEDEPAERAPGAWPEREDEGEPEEAPASESAHTPWPDVEGEDEGYAASPSDGDPVEGVEFGSGLTPEATADAGAEPDGEVVEADAEGGSFRSARASPSLTDRAPTEAGDTELYCPECGHTAPTENASLRPGDICPDCRLGYLTERER